MSDKLKQAVEEIEMLLDVASKCIYPINAPRIPDTDIRLVLTALADAETALRFYGDEDNYKRVKGKPAIGGERARAYFTKHGGKA